VLFASLFSYWWITSFRGKKELLHLLCSAWEVEVFVIGSEYCSILYTRT